jgi:hypothetical protein
VEEFGLSTVMCLDGGGWNYILLETGEKFMTVKEMFEVNV